MRHHVTDRRLEFFGDARCPRWTVQAPKRECGGSRTATAGPRVRSAWRALSVQRLHQRRRVYRFLGGHPERAARAPLLADGVLDEPAKRREEEFRAGPDSGSRSSRCVEAQKGSGGTRSTSRRRCRRDRRLRRCPRHRSTSCATRRATGSSTAATATRTAVRARPGSAPP
jgi:hypothetical protein